MPGPPPKNPKLRQRRNKSSTAAMLSRSDSEKVSGRLSPALPERGKNETPWHEETLQFWAEVWASPMADEYVAADVPGLVMLAKLVDRFNYGEDLAAEIRLQRQCFGLTPLDRRRLQWEIERGESAENRRTRKPAPSKGGKKKDPRSFLRAVK